MTTEGLCVKCGSDEVYFKEGGMRVFLSTRRGTPAVPLETFVCVTCGYAEVRVPPHHMTTVLALVTAPKEGWIRLADNAEAGGEDDDHSPPGHS